MAGIMGSIVLLIGAIWPLEKTKEPTKSVKNWLFASGSFIMLLYAVLGYLSGGSVFFIVLELQVLLAVALMFLGTKDRVNSRLISIAGLLLIIRSVFLFGWANMVLFIFAFIVLWLGYAFKMNTIRRYLWLAIGGALIALSSYLDASRIFFRLNIFFSVFSLYYAIKLIRIYKKPVTKIAASKKIIKKKPAAKKKPTKKISKKK